MSTNQPTPSTQQDRIEALLYGLNNHLHAVNNKLMFIVIIMALSALVSLCSALWASTGIR